MRNAPVALLFVCLAAPAIAGNVWVVGSAPGQQRDLQDTIILAQNGDVVLVKSGNYESIRTLDRSVTIVAEDGATVQCQGAARVLDLQAPHSVALSGIRVNALASTTIPDLAAGLHVRTSTGQVLVQDCTFTYSLPGGNCYGAVNAQNCAGLALVRCSALALGLGNHTSGIAVRGGANVSLDQVAATGTHGGPGDPPPAASSWVADGRPGMPGLSYLAPTAEAPAYVHVSNSQFTGGNGGNGTWGAQFAGFCGSGGSGGDGIFGQIPNGQLRVLGNVLIGGSGGAAGSGPCGLAPGFRGPAGDGIYAGHSVFGLGCYGQGPATAHATIPGAPRTLSGPRIVRDTVQAILTFQGVPGEIVQMAVSSKLIFAPNAAHGGVQHVHAPQWLRVGVVPASGTLQRGYRMPGLPVSNPGATFFVQARFHDVVTGGLRLSNPHVMVVVDATY